MYDAKQLSYYILQKCISDKKEINNERLQDILYFIKEHFSKIGKTIFNEDCVPLSSGPVVRGVFMINSGFGNLPIYFCKDHFIIEKKEDKKIIDEIIEKYREMPAESVFSRLQSGAWGRAILNGDTKIIF